jgi:ribosome recycling factor
MIFLTSRDRQGAVLLNNRIEDGADIMDLNQIQKDAEQAMHKAVDYLKNELRGIRTGRASTGLVEYVKVEYYGQPTELRQLALVTVPEPQQIVIKPYDPSINQEIIKAIEQAGLGLNPQADGKQIRVAIPALTGERRKQLIDSVKEMAEQSRVAIRNARRDANKHVDQLKKDKQDPISEDDADDAKEHVQKLTKKHEHEVDELVESKQKEIEEV